MSSKSEHTPIFLVGGGGHATVVHEAATLTGQSVAGYFDDNPQAPASSRLNRLGQLTDFLTASGPVILAIGDLSIRQRLIVPYDSPLATVTHPSSIISSLAKLGPGSFVGAGAVVNAHCVIGRHAVINSRAVVEHHCNIQSNCHIAPGAVLGGNVSVGENTLIGISAALLPGIHIGANCVVGAGAVVTQDIPSGTVVVGVPAKPIRGMAIAAA